MQDKESKGNDTEDITRWLHYQIFKFNTKKTKRKKMAIKENAKKLKMNNKKEKCLFY